jgi:hypothetical protein
MLRHVLNLIFWGTVTIRNVCLSMHGNENVTRKL